MHQFKKQFDTYMGVKPTPNDQEIALFERAKKYTTFLSYIPGVQMIAVVNSLSMYATHEDSDIDLFIITRPGSIWFVRFFSTALLFILGVWRHGRDIAGNFCLSFFITTEAMDFSKIAIDNDIYLANWIYYMKPLYDVGGVYEAFIQANTWILIKDDKQLINGSRIQSSKGGYTQIGESEGDKLSESDDKQFDGRAIANEFLSPSEPFVSFQLGKERSKIGTFATKSTEKLCLICNSIIRHFLLPRTLSSYEKLGKPEGVIISDTMLKFHDTDSRREIRDAILEKNFDK